MPNIDKERLNQLRESLLNSIDSQLAEIRALEEGRDPSWALDDALRQAKLFHKWMRSGGDAMEGLLYLWEMTDRLAYYLQDARFGQESHKAYKFLLKAQDAFQSDPHDIYRDVEDEDRLDQPGYSLPGSFEIGTLGGTARRR